MQMNAIAGVDPRNKTNDLTNMEWEKMLSSVRIDPQDNQIVKRCKTILDQTKDRLIQTVGLENFQRIWGETFSSSMIYPYQKPDIFVKNHPAPFDIREVEDHIRLFTKEKDIVLDMFSGSGSTLLACLKTGRYGAGIELMDHFIDLSSRRISSYTGQNYNYGANGLFLKKGDVREIMPQMKPCKIDLIISSPPYYKILQHGTGERALQRRSQGLRVHYGNSPNDLGRINHYPTFLSEIAKTYSDCHRVLKLGKYMVLIVHDIFADGAFIPYAFHTSQIVESVGLKLQGIQVVLDTWKRGKPYGIPHRVSFNFHHHYALVFQKI